MQRCAQVDSAAHDGCLVVVQQRRQHAHCGPRRQRMVEEVLEGLKKTRLRIGIGRVWSVGTAEDLPGSQYFRPGYGDGQKMGVAKGHIRRRQKRLVVCARNGFLLVGQTRTSHGAKVGGIGDKALGQLVMIGDRFECLPLSSRRSLAIGHVQGGHVTSMCGNGLGRGDTAVEAATEQGDGACGWRDLRHGADQYRKIDR